MEPEAKLAKILDECLTRVSEGKAIDVCMAVNPDIRTQLEPLLHTGLYVSTALKAQPSEEFRRTAKGRLMARLQEETDQAKCVKVKAEPGISLRDDLAVLVDGLWQTIAGARRAAVPIAIALVLIFATAMGASHFISPSSTLASGCTLSILGGTVEIQAPAEDGIQQGTEGMTLDIGTRVKTAQDSYALLTFFDGSTLKLEPGTDIEIKQLERNDGEAITIILKQWMGKTWSRVVKMADSGSHYEIQTPSAVALVRGTQFLTEVDEAGETKVRTTEGLVSVSAQGDEVFVPAGHQTVVEAGTSPSEPTITSVPEDEEPEEQAQEEQTNTGSYQNEPPVSGQGQSENYGQNQSVELPDEPDPVDEDKDVKVKDKDAEVKDKDVIKDKDAEVKDKDVEVKDKDAKDKDKDVKPAPTNPPALPPADEPEPVDELVPDDEPVPEDDKVKDKDKDKDVEPATTPEPVDDKVKDKDKDT
jgi:hypothetical protein